MVPTIFVRGNLLEAAVSRRPMHYAHRARGWFLCAALAACALPACNESKDGVSAQAERSLARPARGPSGPTQKDYCKQACERAAACGVEEVEKAIKGTPAEIKLRDQARDDAANVRASCEQTCGTGGSAEEDRKALEAASQCLQQQSCETFGACMAKAGG